MTFLQDLSPLFHDVHTFCVKAYVGMNFEVVKDGIFKIVGSQIKTFIMSGFKLKEDQFQFLLKGTETRNINPLIRLKLAGNQLEITPATFNDNIVKNLKELELSSCYLSEQSHVGAIISYIKNFHKLEKLKIDHNKFSEKDLEAIFLAAREKEPNNTLREIIYSSFLTQPAVKEKIAQLMAGSNIKYV